MVAERNTKLVPSGLRALQKAFRSRSSFRTYFHLLSIGVREHSKVRSQTLSWRIGMPESLRPTVLVLLTALLAGQSAEQVVNIQDLVDDLIKNNPEIRAAQFR